MLKNTFCHFPGVGLSTERRLWEFGVQCWEDLIGADAAKLAWKRRDSLADHVRESFKHFEKSNPKYFAELLPSDQQWRLFSDFRDKIAYLDIETTGLNYADQITTIAVYDGESIFTYVQGQNLNTFKEDIKKYSVIVTFNGKCFDIPFLQRYFNVPINQAHIDLRYVLQSLGYRGGLKECERRLGIDRGDLINVDGFFAVLLWDDFKRNKNQKALETLLAYNIQDVVNLETLMTIAFNRKLKDTPFEKERRLSHPAAPAIPFKADVRTISDIKKRYSYF
ncbi:MAG TPA: ribonuclease H-like domain-containing protein [Blastocatellia bacterium]|nr:ribonuclease H-like domain-containing protein [Blastocatellia bacterium]